MKKVKLGDIATTITKGTTPTTIGFNFVDDGVNFVKIESISDDGNFLKEKFGHIEERCNKKMQRSQLQENDILFSIAGAIGRVAIVNKEILPANTNQALAIIRIANGMVFYPYLLYVLKSSFVYEQFEKKKQGVAQLNLSLKDVSDLEISLPSLEEQKEIADRLDKVSSLIEKRKTQLLKLDQLIKSRFIEMFGDPVDNDKDWKTDELQNVISINKYKGKVDLINNKVWLLNLDMIESNTGEILDYVYENEEDVPNSTIKFNNNSVLYSKLRPYLNKVVIPTKCGYATSELVSMNPNSLINKYFLAGLLRYESFVNFANGTAYGAKMPRASVDEIKKFRLILPPIELQNQFATFVEQTDKTKLAIQKSIDKLETLKKSLMQQYFG